MRRGAIVLIREKDSPAAKLRPCVIVQRSSTLDLASRITACPVTSVLKGPQGGRPFVAPSVENGLHSPSEVEFDWIYSFGRHRIITVIGQLEELAVTELDQALHAWLGL